METTNGGFDLMNGWLQRSFKGCRNAGFPCLLLVVKASFDGNH